MNTKTYITNTKNLTTQLDFTYLMISMKVIEQLKFQLQISSNDQYNQHSIVNTLN